MITDLAEWMNAAPRASALQFLAGAIHSLTICSRGFYNAPNAHEGMRAINEALHRLAGYFMYLADGTKPLEPRWAGIIAGEADRRLSEDEIDRILAHCRAKSDWH